MGGPRVVEFKGWRELATSMLSSRGFLVFGLLAVAALTRPYGGLVHDARLYSVQVANQMRDGHYQEDLFFAGGSQDSFSIFSHVMAPLASTIGIENAFWSGFMVFTALLVLAEVKLIKRLVPQPELALVSMVLVTVSTISYGGRGVFHVHENYFTARLPAEALVLFAVVQCLSGRRWLSLILGCAAMLVHPLVAVSGLAVVGGCVVLSTASRRVSLGLTAAACASGTALLLAPTTCRHLLGQFDAHWYWVSYRVSGHCFLTQWDFQDWAAIFVSVTTVIIARRQLNRSASDFCLLVILVAVAGLAATLLAEGTGYALVLRGQAYRSLWILQLLAMILAVPVSWRLLHEPGKAARFAGVIIAAYHAQIVPISLLGLPQAARLLALSASAYVVARVIGGDANWSGMRRSAVITLVCLMLIGVLESVGVCAALSTYLSTSGTEPIMVWHVLVYLTSSFVWCLLGLAVLCTVYRACGRGGQAVAVIAVLWLLLSSGTYMLQVSPTYRQRFQIDHANVEFVRTWLDQQGAMVGSDTQVYWPTDVTHIWFGLKRNSYYSRAQIQGVLFSRDVAIEGRRRESLARSFERASWRRSPSTRTPRNGRRLLLDAERNGSAPAVDDLLELAADTRLHWIVVPHRFDGLFAASNGEVYIYNAAAIRPQRQDGK